MSGTTTLYLTIGNSDDRLTQERWSAFVTQTDIALTDGPGRDQYVTRRHGFWLSHPTSPWQNACWCVEVPDYAVDMLRAKLGRLCAAFGQDSIAWAPAVVEFIGPTKVGTR